MIKTIKVYLIPETCLECSYFQKFEYLESGFSKPIETLGGGQYTSCISHLTSDGRKIYNGLCSRFGALIKDGDELTKLYYKNHERKQCNQEFPIEECTNEQIKSVL